MTRDGADVVCVGGSTVDRFYRAVAPVRMGTSNPVVQERGFGGVARNVAEGLARLGSRVALVSAVGRDESGRALVAHLAGLGIDVGAVLEGEGATAEYVAVTEPAGELALGLADMGVFDALEPDTLARAGERLRAASLVFADCNLPAPSLSWLAAVRRAGEIRALAVDAVSVAKAARLPRDLAGVDLLFLNADEAGALAGALPPEEAAAALRARGAGAVVLTRGSLGLVLADGDGIAALPAMPVARVVDVTGAGDALVAGTLRGLIDGKPLRAALRLGLAAAALALERPGGVPQDLSPALLERAMARAP